jgi:hypothetical protein
MKPMTENIPSTNNDDSGMRHRLLRDRHDGYSSPICTLRLEGIMVFMQLVWGIVWGGKVGADG